MGRQLPSTKAGMNAVLCEPDDGMDVSRSAVGSRYLPAANNDYVDQFNNNAMLLLRLQSYNIFGMVGNDTD